MKNRRALSFENLQRIADLLVATFGKFCEVAIHDFSDLQHSLVYISGEVTKRKPGAPITDLVLKEWKREGDRVPDMASYKTLTKNGKILKSSTVFLRNQQGQVVGAFCINFDLTQFLDSAALLRDFSLVSNYGNGNVEGETFANSVDETIESLISQAIRQVGKQPATMGTEDRINFVEILEKKGAFLIKGGVSYIASLLGVSKFTTYNYLQKARSREKLGIHYPNHRISREA